MVGRQEGFATVVKVLVDVLLFCDAILGWVVKRVSHGNCYSN